MSSASVVDPTSARSRGDELLTVRASTLTRARGAPEAPTYRLSEVFPSVHRASTTAEDERHAVYMTALWRLQYRFRQMLATESDHEDYPDARDAYRKSADYFHSLPNPNGDEEDPFATMLKRGWDDDEEHAEPPPLVRADLDDQSGYSSGPECDLTDGEDSWVDSSGEDLPSYDDDDDFWDGPSPAPVILHNNTSLLEDPSFDSDDIPDLTDGETSSDESSEEDGDEDVGAVVPPNPPAVAGGAADTAHTPMNLTLRLNLHHLPGGADRDVPSDRDDDASSRNSTVISYRESELAYSDVGSVAYSEAESDVELGVSVDEDDGDGVNMGDRTDADHDSVDEVAPTTPEHVTTSPMSEESDSEWETYEVFRGRITRVANVPDSEYSDAFRGTDLFRDGRCPANAPYLFGMEGDVRPIKRYGGAYGEQNVQPPLYVFRDGLKPHSVESESQWMVHENDQFEPSTPGDYHHTHLSFLSNYSSAIEQQTRWVVNARRWERFVTNDTDFRSTHTNQRVHELRCDIGHFCREKAFLVDRLRSDEAHIVATGMSDQLMHPLALDYLAKMIKTRSDSMINLLLQREFNFPHIEWSLDDEEEFDPNDWDYMISDRGGVFQERRRLYYLTTTDRQLERFGSPADDWGERCTAVVCTARGCASCAWRERKRQRVMRGREDRSKRRGDRHEDRDGPDPDENPRKWRRSQLGDDGKTAIGLDATRSGTRDDSAPVDGVHRWERSADSLLDGQFSETTPGPQRSADLTTEPVAEVRGEVPRKVALTSDDSTLRPLLDDGVLHQEHVECDDPVARRVLYGDGSLITNKFEHTFVLREEFVATHREVVPDHRLGVQMKELEFRSITYEPCPSEAELAARYGHGVMEKAMFFFHRNGIREVLAVDAERPDFPAWQVDGDSILGIDSWVATRLTTPRTGTPVPHPSAPSLRRVSLDIGGMTFSGYYQMAPDFPHHVRLDKGTQEWILAMSYFYYYDISGYDDAFHVYWPTMNITPMTRPPKPMYYLDSVVDYGLRRISNDGIRRHCVAVESMLFRALAVSRLATPEQSSEDHRIGVWDASHRLYQQYAMRVLMVWRETMFSMVASDDHCIPEEYKLCQRCGAQCNRDGENCWEEKRSPFHTKWSTSVNGFGNESKVVEGEAEVHRLPLQWR